MPMKAGFIKENALKQANSTQNFPGGDGSLAPRTPSPTAGYPRPATPAAGDARQAAGWPAKQYMYSIPEHASYMYAVLYTQGVI